MSIAEDRRESRRKSISVSALLRVNLKSCGAKTVDINCSGLKVCADECFAQSDILEIEFPIFTTKKGMKTLKAKTKVAHVLYSSKSGGFMHGLSFQAISEADVEHIRTYLSE